MPEDLSLTELAQLDALNETTPEQRAHVLAACDADPAFAEECRQIRSEIRTLICAIGPKSEPPAGSILPANILDILERERTLPFPSPGPARDAAEAAGAAGAAARAPRPVWTRRFALAAAVAIFAGVVATQFSGKKPMPAGVTLSPGGETAFTTPTLRWENTPGVVYDVWVLPAGADQAKTPPLFVKNNVTSSEATVSVPFHELIAKTNAKELVPNTDYGFLVCVNNHGKPDRLAGTLQPFRVSGNASALIAAKTPAEALSAMRSLVTAGKKADALGLFATFSKAIQQNAELAAYDAALRKP